MYRCFTARGLTNFRFEDFGAVSRVYSRISSLCSGGSMQKSVEWTFKTNAVTANGFIRGYQFHAEGQRKIVFIIKFAHRVRVERASRAAE